MEKILFGVDGLTFTEEEVKKALQSKSPLTVDMAIPSSCRNNCIYCGWADKPRGHGLSKEEIFYFFKEFKKIGGKSVRILGRGEPLSRKDILEILEFINKLEITPVLFTCGDVLGDDEYCKSLHGMNGVSFIEELQKINVSIILKYEKNDEDSITGTKGYSERRNKALKRILDAGFNLNSPSKIGFASVVLLENHDELPKIYERSLKENIYPFFCPIMPVGKAKEKINRERMGVTGKKLIDLAIKLHIIAFQYGIEYKRPSDFIGTLPCYITMAGFYVDDSGDATLCAPDKIFGNIRQKSLSELWQGINNLKRKLYGDKGCNEGKCFPKRLTSVISEDFDKQVDKRVKEYISKHQNEFNSKKKKWNFDYIVK